jgi:uncharacterized SAM-binding protein YcdF (DUF218 family)
MMMTQGENGTNRPRRRWILYLCLGFLALLLAGCVGGFLYVGRWLVMEDPLQTAHAIVVLSGRLPDRAIEAARIYQANFAAQVWVSQPVSPAAQLEKMHIAFIGEDFYNQKVLMARGVPADAIRVLMDPSANTEQEVDEIARDCRRDDAHLVIIVTSKPHTRRVRMIWDRRVGADPRAIVRYVSDDPFDPAHWWSNTSDALDVVREVLGIANVLAGFPLHPELH